MSLRKSLAWFVSIVFCLLLLPTVSAQTVDCPGAPTSLLADDVEDAVAAGAQALYAEADARAAVVATVPDGEAVNVLWRTACVDGALWRKLVYAGVVGFAPEMVDGTPAFVPYVPPDPVKVSVPGPRVTSIVSDLLVADYATALANRFVMQPQIGYSFPDAISPTPNYTLYWPDDDTLVQRHPRQAFIAIYPVADWREISDSVSTEIDELQAQLAERPDLPLMNPDTGRRAPLVDLPFRNAGQLVRASQRYVDFENGAGIRLVAYYAQMTGELCECFVYEFNGITHDGRYYVSAEFPIRLRINRLPPYDEEADLAAGEEPMNSYYVQYLEQVSAAIEALDDDQITPSLQMLDDFVTSFSVGEH